MADRNDDLGGNRDNERMGRGVHEGLNAGRSRNAHQSGGASQSAGASESGRIDGDDQDKGRGGYGDDTGFTGGTSAADEGMGRTRESGASGGGVGRSTSGRSTGDERGADAVDESRGMRATSGSGDAESHNSPRAAAPGSEGATVEDHSRIDGVGHQAPSGMDERESSGETR